MIINKIMIFTLAVGLFLSGSKIVSASEKITESNNLDTCILTYTEYTNPNGCDTGVWSARCPSGSCYFAIRVCESNVGGVWAVSYTQTTNC